MITPTYFIVDDRNADAFDNLNAIRKADPNAQVETSLRDTLNSKESVDERRGSFFQALKTLSAVNQAEDDDPNTRIFVAKHPYDLKLILDKLKEKVSTKLQGPMIFFTDGDMREDQVYKDSPKLQKLAKPYNHQAGTSKVIKELVQFCKKVKFQLGNFLRVLVSSTVDKSDNLRDLKPGLINNPNIGINLCKPLNANQVKDLTNYLEREIKAKAKK